MEQITQFVLNKSKKKIEIEFMGFASTPQLAPIFGNFADTYFQS